LGHPAAAPVSRRCGWACASCGHSGRYAAFVDETGRGSTYGLAAAIVCRCELATVRQAVRRLVRPGQRRVHFAKEQDRNRKSFLSAVARTSVRALFVATYGRPAIARSECWALLVPELISYGVGELVIESVAGSEDDDRRDIRNALASKGLLEQLTYRHRKPAEEPMLWVADAIAWAAAARAPWRARIASILLEP
jgi:hypothetical protein